MPTETVESKETRTISRPPFESPSGELLRKVLAAIVGIVIIIALVLLAKWVGDQIRARYLVPKTPSPTTQVIPPEDNVVTPAPQTGAGGTTAPATTTTPTQGTVGFPGKSVSAIPATGPNDWAYILLGIFALTGISSLYFSKKFFR